MPDPITFDELLREMQRVSNGEGFTTSEFMAAKGISVTRAREIIRRGIARKVLRVSRKPITDMAGRVMTVASYVFVKRGKP